MLGRVAGLCFVISVGLAAPAMAGDNDTIKWKTVNGWDIAIDPSVGGGCYISAIFKGYTVFRFGFMNAGKDAYLGVANAKWTSLEVGKDYDLAVVFDHERPWKLSASAIRMAGGSTMLAGLVGQTDFIRDVMTKHAISIFYNGNVVVRLSLKGTYGAIQEMLACQGAVNQIVLPKKPVDPFDDPASKPKPVSSDPFST